ncbi:MAG TPA: hypothetical protein PKA64_20240, partial [Myxococcota bacterium]|nr:hypothetical protein [Myxococcota bacterium]
AHVWRGADAGSRCWVRIGRETREARNGLLLQLLERRGQRPAWGRRHPPNAEPSDVDLLALRDTLVRVGRDIPASAVDARLSEEQTISVFVPPLCARDPLSRALRPRNFTLLLFGRVPQMACSEAFCLFSRYPGTDRSTPVSVRHEIAGTVVQQAQRLIKLVVAEAWQVMDKEDVRRPNLRRYPERALREAVVNAIVHRSYEEPHPIRVTAFADRVEIWSPGGPPRQVEPEAMARGAPGVAQPGARVVLQPARPRAGAGHRDDPADDGGQWQPAAGLGDHAARRRVRAARPPAGHGAPAGPARAGVTSGAARRQIGRPGPPSTRPARQNPMGWTYTTPQRLAELSNGPTRVGGSRKVNVVPTDSSE